MFSLNSFEATTLKKNSFNSEMYPSGETKQRFQFSSYQKKDENNDTQDTF